MVGHPVDGLHHLVLELFQTARLINGVQESCSFLVAPFFSPDALHPGFLIPMDLLTVVLNGGSGGGYPKSGPKLNFNGSGAS